MLEQKRGGYGNEGEHRGKFYEHDTGIEVRGFLDADDQDDGDGEDAEESKQVKPGDSHGGGGELRRSEVQRDQRRPAAIEEDPLGAGDVADLRRQVDTVILQKGDERATPAAGDGRRTE